MVEAAAAAQSSFLEFEKQPMSKTSARTVSPASSPGRREAARPGDLSLTKKMDGRIKSGHDECGNGNGLHAAGVDLLGFAGQRRFSTILADPPWQFTNKTGKVAPEHKRLARYSTLTLEEIASLPVAGLTRDTAHLYLWCPNAMLPEGLAVLKAWGFTYKSNIVWHKVRKDGGSDGRGVGFYFRNVTELILFGVRGKNARTLAPGRRQVNLLGTRKREHSRKPDEQYDIIEACSPGPFLELFGRGTRKGWTTWGDQADNSYSPTWKTYAHHSRAEFVAAE